jgi:hypothetical protein
MLFSENEVRDAGLVIHSRHSDFGRALTALSDLPKATFGLWSRLVRTLVAGIAVTHRTLVAHTNKIESNNLPNSLRDQSPNIPQESCARCGELF